MAGGAEELTYDEESFIAKEDATILLSRDGWLRRVQKVSDLSKVRLRHGDELLSVLRGSTLSVAVFFSNYGTAYSLRVNDIPASSRGYGEPIQALCKFSDGEKIVAATCLDERLVDLQKDQGLAVATDGRGLRFSLEPFAEPSTRSGRKYARCNAAQEIMGVQLVDGSEMLVAASRFGRALICKVEEVNFLTGAGKGVMVMKLSENDRMIAFKPITEESEGLVLIREDGGRELKVTPRKYRLVSRGGKGHPLIKRGLLTVVPEPVTLPVLPGEEEITSEGEES